jgi:putative inorganic carbon (hco3(-)) transporter
MGFALTLMYIALTIVSPYQFGQEFADYHPMIYLAGITALVSLPKLLTNSQLQSSVQTRLLLGFIIAIALSQGVNGWFGGAVESAREILPSAAVFFFIMINVDTLRKLNALTWVTIATCVALTVEVLCGYYGGFQGDKFVLLQYGEIRRLRAAGFLSDPNDLAQILLIALSLTVATGDRARTVLVSLTVLAPAVLLLWAIYLTHSRGALIALGVLALVTLRKKIGSVPSAVLAICLVLGMMALNFTGGRGISASDGSDRLELWSQGLELFRRSPLFGTGFGSFADLSGLTAHNSFILCLAELGLAGSTIFVALLVSTMFGLYRIIESDDAKSEASCFAVFGDEDQPAAAEWEPTFYEQQTETATTSERAIATELTIPSPLDVEKCRTKPFAIATSLALITFITTSFFLSRSYTATFYLILGMGAATIALEQKAVQYGARHRWGLVSLALECVAILFIYVIVRLRH